MENIQNKAIHLANNKWVLLVSLLVPVFLVAVRINGLLEAPGFNLFFGATGLITGTVFALAILVSELSSLVPGLSKTGRITVACVSYFIIHFALAILLD